MFSRIHISVSGNVQGVFFRAGAKAKADRLGVLGMARNLPDGTVEVVAEGERPKLEEMLDWCFHGPAEAKVTDIEFGWEEPKREFSGFTIVR